jgi:hypothetical protein
VKVAFYAVEVVLALAVAAGAGLGAGWLAGWLTAALWHQYAAAAPAGVILRLSRGRHPLWAVERWHGAAVRRLDGRDG